MKLGELKDYIEAFPKHKVFDYGISEPFSWRGRYNEVAFKFLKNKPMSREDILSRINQALQEDFVGYKGGYFQYNPEIDINFEQDYGSYTDGRYVIEILEGITEDEYKDNEEKLIKTAFKN